MNKALALFFVLALGTLLTANLPAKSCKVKSFEAPVAGSVQFVSDSTTAKAVMHFECRAEFDPTSPFDCECCEFRQKIKGEFKKNNVIQKVVLTEDGPAGSTYTTGVDLPPLTGTAQEDSRGTGAARGRYGHRKDPRRWQDQYTRAKVNTPGPIYSSPPDDRPAGCFYRMIDEPGRNGGLVSKDHFEAHLLFEDSIVDVCAEGAPKTVTSTTIPVDIDYTMP